MSLFLYALICTRVYCSSFSRFVASGNPKECSFMASIAMKPFQRHLVSTSIRGLREYLRILRVFEWSLLRMIIVETMVHLHLMGSTLSCLWSPAKCCSCLFQSYFPGIVRLVASTGMYLNFTYDVVQVVGSSIKQAVLASICFRALSVGKTIYKVGGVGVWRNVLLRAWKGVGLAVYTLWMCISSYDTCPSCSPGCKKA